MPRFASSMCLALLGFTGCEGPLEFRFPPDQPGPRTEAELRQELSNWGVVPLRALPQQNAAQVELGRALFFDKILSGNRDISCATCHDPIAFLGDGLSLPVGTGGTGLGPARRLGAERQFVPRGETSQRNQPVFPLYRLRLLHRRALWTTRLSCSPSTSPRAMTRTKRKVLSKRRGRAMRATFGGNPEWRAGR